MLMLCKLYIFIFQPIGSKCRLARLGQRVCGLSIIFLYKRTDIKMAEPETQVAETENQLVDGQQNGEGGALQEEPMESQDLTEQGGGDALTGDPKDDDEDERNLFVGGLSWETTQKDLKDYFGKFGEVSNCTLKTDMETKRSRGFGFVVFADAASIDKVLVEKEHKLHGRNIDPKRANPRQSTKIKKIFVGKLDPGVPETTIREYFTKYGKIEKLDLPYDKTKDQRRAFCFVEFESDDAVDKVIEQTVHELGGQEVDIKKATPTPQNRRGGRGWGPSFGGRGGWNQGSYNGGGYNQGYGGYNQGYGGYGNYGGYGGYGAYDQGYYQGYGSGGWGGYDQNYYGYDYGGGWGYDQGQEYENTAGTDGQQQSGYGKTPKRGGQTGGNAYHPYNR